MAGCRWSIETSFQTSKSIDLDEHQLRRWTSWHRHTTLVMLAYAILAVIAAREQQLQPDGRQGLIPLTVKEIRRLFAKLVINTVHTIDHWLAWPDGDGNTRHAPVPATTDAGDTSAIKQHLHNKPGL